MVNTIYGKIFLTDHTNLRETSPVSIYVQKKEKLQCLFYDLGYILLPTFCVIDWHDGGLYIQMELSNVQKVKNVSISMKFKFKVQPTMSIQGLLPFFLLCINYLFQYTLRRNLTMTIQFSPYLALEGV